MRNNYGRNASSSRVAAILRRAGLNAYSNGKRDEGFVVVSSLGRESDGYVLYRVKNDSEMRDRERAALDECAVAINAADIPARVSASGGMLFFGTGWSA